MSGVFASRCGFSLALRGGDRNRFHYCVGGIISLDGCSEGESVLGGINRELSRRRLRHGAAEGQRTGGGNAASSVRFPLAGARDAREKRRTDGRKRQSVGKAVVDERVMEGKNKLTEQWIH